MQLMTGKEKQVWIEMLGAQFSLHWIDVQLYRGQTSKDKEKKCSLLFQNCALSISKWSESIAALDLLWLGVQEISSMPSCQADCVGKRDEGHIAFQEVGNYALSYLRKFWISTYLNILLCFAGIEFFSSDVRVVFFVMEFETLKLLSLTTAEFVYVLESS